MTTTTVEERPALTIKDGVVLSFQDLGLWKGEIATDLPPAGSSPELRWTGAPIPMGIWRQLAGFFRHANATWKSEAQARLFYKAETKEWKVVVAPQRVGTGMYSGELKGYSLDAEKSALRSRIFAEADGFLPNGTMHSHCDCSAFQSGTDHEDEVSQPGIHVTLGRISSDKVHVHGRVSLRKVLYPVVWTDWFPDWPEGLDPRRDEFDLELPEGTDLSFPKEWLDACFPYAAPPPATVYGGAKRYNRETRSWEPYSFPASEAGYGYGFGRREEEDEWRPSEGLGKKRSSRIPDDLSGILDACERDFADVGCSAFAAWATTQLRELVELDPTADESDLYELADRLMDGYNAFIDGPRTLMDEGLPLELAKAMADEYVYGKPEDGILEELPDKAGDPFPWNGLD